MPALSVIEIADYTLKGRRGLICTLSAILGRETAVFISNKTIIARRAAGYMPSATGPVNAGFVHMSVPHAAGALYSTTEDLLRWEQGLFGGKVVSPASLAKMTTPFKNDYALGVAVQTASGRKVVQHGGGIDGFNTFLAYYPDDKLTVAVLANINGQTPNQIATKLADLAHGGVVQLTSERKEITLPVATLSTYVGTYQMPSNVELSVTLDGNQLMAQLTGQPKLPIFAESETLFFFKIVEATLEFQKDASGAVTAVRLRQGSINVLAPRT